MKLEQKKTPTLIYNEIDIYDTKKCLRFPRHSGELCCELWQHRIDRSRAGSAGGSALELRLLLDILP